MRQLSIGCHNYLKIFKPALSIGTEGARRKLPQKSRNPVPHKTVAYLGTL